LLKAKEINGDAKFKTFKSEKVGFIISNIVNDTTSVA
jgi:hypothetical protein